MESKASNVDLDKRLNVLERKIDLIHDFLQGLNDSESDGVKALEKDFEDIE